MNSDLKRLKKIPLFENLDTASLKKIQALLKQEKFKKGSTVIKEGDKGDSLFIILQGEVVVIKGKGRTKEKVTSLQPFNFFGEMSLLEDKPRSASIVAEQDSLILKLDKKDFVRLVGKFPDISFKIMKTLSARIRETDLKLIEDLKKKNKELEKAYTDLKNVQGELIKAERLSTIGRVAGGIIHDLKNHLSVVKGYAEYIKHNKEAPEPFHHAANTMLQVITIILNMIQEVLDFAKGEYRLEKIPVSIDKFTKEVAGISSKEFESRNITLKLHLHAGCDCNIDPQRMRRVFLNIISNACDAMSDGGTLTISTAKKKDKIDIEFKDTGIGIDKETLKHIFEPFYSKGKKKGIGLGTSIAKRFVEDHDGSIKIISSIGKGTTVTIILPSIDKK
jgi:signal transduction histidine kinase